jgi:hypothetical protein
MLLTKPESPETLRRFYEQTRPVGPGWRKVREAAEAIGQPLSPAEGPSLPGSLLMVFVGSVGIYSGMLGIGSALYGNAWIAAAFLATFAGAAWMIARYLFGAGRHG